MCACRTLGATAAAAISSAVLLLTATVLPALAHAEPERVHIQFSAPEPCPDAAAFIRAVRQRTLRFRLARSSEQARTFVAAIAQAGSLFSGRLETHAIGKQPSYRNVTGQSCDEVTAVLAFMTALAIDPKASVQNARAQRPVSPGLPSPTTPPPAGASDRAEAATVTDLSPQEQPGSIAPSPPSVPAAGPATETPGSGQARNDSSPVREAPSVAVAHPPTPVSGIALSAPWRWSAGAQVAATVAISPTTGLGGLVFVEAAAPGTAVLGPVLRAGLFLSRSNAALADGAEAEFQWGAILLEGCPLRMAAFDSRVALHGCLALHLGALRAQGDSLARSEQTTDLWADLGPAARIRVAVSEHLSLEAQGTLALPLRRLSYDVYYAGPSGSPTTVHTTPWLAALVGIGVAYQFR